MTCPRCQVTRYFGCSLDGCPLPAQKESDSRTTVLVNGLKAIADMNEQNRDLADAKVMARRTLRDAKIEESKNA